MQIQAIFFSGHGNKNVMYSCDIFLVTHTVCTRNLLQNDFYAYACHQNKKKKYPLCQSAALGRVNGSGRVAELNGGEVIFPSD